MADWGAGCWAVWLGQIERAMAARGVDASAVVVLVPYAQLMQAGRQAWALAHPCGFAPRFESTRNWAASLEPFLPAPTDLSMDAARDALVAAAFLRAVAGQRLEGALDALLVGRLVQAATELAPLAAACAPEQRVAWASARSGALSAAGGLGSLLQWESLIASLALTWVGQSSYATDVLWGPRAQPGGVAQCLLVLPGFQQDPLVQALVAHWGERAEVLGQVQGADGVWVGGSEGAGAGDKTVPRLHACADAQDEAQRAAACVIEHANAQRVPVALVANDRMLARRVSALLQGAGLQVRDETGWRLSTTRAAAELMALLRAAHGQASMDDVVDLLKQCSAWPPAQVQQVQRLEQLARLHGVRSWRAACESPQLAAVLPEGLAPVLASLQGVRSLVQWLHDVSRALVAVGLWARLAGDRAGQQLLLALRLGDGAAQDIEQVEQALGQWGGAGARLSLWAFTAWVRDVLEAATFKPVSAGAAQVVVLPMAQLLGREFAATVIPGCDEEYLNPSPDPLGQWTPAQREILGLPSRQWLAQGALRAWHNALSMPQLDVLWRTQESGQTRLPSVWVQALLPVKTAQSAHRADRVADEGPGLSDGTAADPRLARWLEPEPVREPLLARAGDLVPDSLSASAYEDLRDCPYRFFALRQLRLRDAPELESELDQRDMGNWLHAVLRAFHEQRGDQRPGVQADRAALDACGQRLAQRMGLNTGPGEAGFFPYQASWEGLRDGYLQWLGGFEATAGRSGAVFLKAEEGLRAQVGRWRIEGKLDRIDAHDTQEGRGLFVIDYKTESREKTKARVKNPLEDTQLAFYAALLPQSLLRAAYLSLVDKPEDPTGEENQAVVLFEQIQVLRAREHLLAAVEHDMDRIAAGHAMRALGEGRACDFCAARGLCRKDFWSAV